MKMQRTDVRRDPTRALPRPSPIGLSIRVILGALSIYLFVALLTKWNVFLNLDPIESERYYTLFTVCLLPYVLNLTFRRGWGPGPGCIVGLDHLDHWEASWWSRVAKTVGPWQRR